MQLKKIQSNRLTLTIDSREPQKWKAIVSKIAKQEGFDVNIHALKYGDYMTDNAIVERKTVMDLMSSLYDKRFEKQFDGIDAQADWEDKIPILLVCGSVRELIDVKETVGLKMDPALVYGAISSIVVRTGAYLIWVEDETDAMITLVKVLKKIEQGKWLKPRRRNVRVLLARALGIQPWQLDELLKECGSLVEIGLASEKKLQAVSGIGPKKAEQIKKILTGTIG